MNATQIPREPTCACVAYLTQREWLSHALHAICSSARNKAPRGVAVTFSYGVMAFSDTDLHRIDKAPSQAHRSQVPLGNAISTALRSVR